MFIYLHGFNSSPASFKSRLMAQRLAELGRGGEFACPELSHWPARAIACAETEISRHAPGTPTLIGSSLGGYYANFLAERHGLAAVLLNPSVRPHERLSGFVGRQKNLYTGAEYEFTTEHVEQLRALDVPAITRPERYLLIVASGDEVLDYRQAVTHYRGARQIVVPGSDHGFAEFRDYLDETIAFGDAAARSRA